MRYLQTIFIVWGLLVSAYSCADGQQPESASSRRAVVSPDSARFPTTVKNFVVLSDGGMVLDGLDYDNQDQNARIFRVDTEGKILWEISDIHFLQLLSNYGRQFIEHDGLILYQQDEATVAVDMMTGKEKWRHDMEGRKYGDFVMFFVEEGIGYSIYEPVNYMGNESNWIDSMKVFEIDLALGKIRAEWIFPNATELQIKPQHLPGHLFLYTDRNHYEDGKNSHFQLIDLQTRAVVKEQHAINVAYTPGKLFFAEKSGIFEYDCTNRKSRKISSDRLKQPKAADDCLIAYRHQNATTLHYRAPDYESKTNRMYQVPDVGTTRTLPWRNYYFFANYPRFWDVGSYPLSFNQSGSLPRYFPFILSPKPEMLADESIPTDWGKAPTNGMAMMDWETGWPAWIAQRSDYAHDWSSYATVQWGDYFLLVGYGSYKDSDLTEYVLVNGKTGKFAGAVKTNIGSNYGFQQCHVGKDRFVGHNEKQFFTVRLPEMTVAMQSHSDFKVEDYSAEFIKKYGIPAKYVE